jgi:hypothetical protein
MEDPALEGRWVFNLVLPEIEPRDYNMMQGETGCRST